MNFRKFNNELLQNIMFRPQDVFIDTGKETVVADRKNYIGGSDIPIIMGIDTRFDTAFGLACKKAGIKPFKYTTSVFAQYGDLREPEIRDYVNKLYNSNFTPACLMADRFRANTDGYDENLNGILEIKTNNGKDDQFHKYEVQMLFYMMCYRKEYGLLAEYSRASDLKGIMFDSSTESGFRENLPDDFNKPFDEKRVKITFVPYDREKAFEILRQIHIFNEKVKAVKKGIIENEYEYKKYEVKKPFVIDK